MLPLRTSYSMKTNILTLVAIIATAFSAVAHEKKAGPNGGRLIENIDPQAEVFVTPERKVQITFLSKEGKVLSPEGRAASVTTGERSAPVDLAFAPVGEVLVSTAALPEGENFPAIVRITPAAGQKPVVVRFQLNLAQCSACDHKEYACTCGH